MYTEFWECWKMNTNPTTGSEEKRNHVRQTPELVFRATLCRGVRRKQPESISRWWGHGRGCTHRGKSTGAWETVTWINVLDVLLGISQGQRCLTPLVLCQGARVEKDYQCSGDRRADSEHRCFYTCAHCSNQIRYLVYLHGQFHCGENIRNLHC